MFASKVRNSQLYPLVLVLSSSLMFWLGWPTKPLTPLLFLAFAPLLALEDFYSRSDKPKRGRRFFGYLYLSFVISNLLTTWWVYYATAVGMVAMILANSLLMCIPWLLFRYTKRAAGPGWGYFGLILYWITFEYIHLNWDLSWPWLTLGNGFAMQPMWIQWYEYTGVFGGTIWILLSNLAFYFVFFSGDAIFKGIIRWRSLVYTLIWILLPIGISLIIYSGYQEKGEPVEVVVLQPNIDPYTEKFVGTANFIPFPEQVKRFTTLSSSMITEDTDFLVWPETAIDKQISEDALNIDPIIRQIKAFRLKHLQTAMVTGVTTQIVYKGKNEAPPTARRSRKGDIYFDVFNTALFVGNESEVVAYHKSKLVPGVEIMPYPQVLGVVSEVIFDLGGTSGGFGRQKERTVFYNRDSIGVAPSVCYESIYGDFMSEFVLNGANLIFIITNDAWWGDSDGYKQHLHYATLRAIENRRSIARSANTGISAFIDQRGIIHQPTAFYTQAVIQDTIMANDELTFYSRYGDYLARTAAWLSVFVILAAFVKKRVV